jgi:hypothetical protein
LWHLSLYTLYYMCCLLWRMYEMHLALFLKTGCDRSGIRGMLTIGRNLDRNGQILTYLPYSNSFYTCLDPVSPSTVLLWLTLPLLLWFISTLILIFSHLILLSSDYSYLFLLKTNVDFTLWNHVPKVTFMNRGPTLRGKNYFYRYLYAWVFVLVIFVWFGSLIECDELWSNVQNYIYIYV